MRVLLTSAGLETEEIKECFIGMAAMDMQSVKALFIPTAATDAGAVQVLPKCMNDLLKCGIREENIKVYDLHTGMKYEELRQYDVVYLCGGDAEYLLDRINETGFNRTLTDYIREDGMVIGVSAGSIIFANNLCGNLGLIDAALEVHCEDGDKRGKVRFPLKDVIRLTNDSALAIRGAEGEGEVI